MDDYEELEALIAAGDIRAAERRVAELTAAGDLEAWSVLGDILDDEDVLAALAEGDTSVLLDLGDAVAEQGDSHQAITLYRQAIAAGEKLAWNNLGIELENVGKYGQARKAFAAGAQLGDELAAENLAKAREHRHRHWYSAVSQSPVRDSRAGCGPWRHRRNAQRQPVFAAFRRRRQEPPHRIPIPASGRGRLSSNGDFETRPRPTG